LAPDPRLTTPTTRYVTQRSGAVLAKSADYGMDVPQHAHWPLVMMLVLTQLAVGVLLVERLLTLSFAIHAESQVWANFQVVTATASWLFAITGLGIANLHLGRPWLAFRAVLGWRTSWLSREVLAFGAFLAIDGLYVLMLWQRSHWGVPIWMVESVGCFAAATAIVAAVSSAFVYIATKRSTWSARRVLLQFGVSITLLGLTTGLTILNVAAMFVSEMRTSSTVASLATALLAAIALLTGARLAVVRVNMWRLGNQQRTGQPLGIELRVMRLLAGPLTRHSTMRLIFGLLSGVILPLFILCTPWAESWLSWPIYLATQLLILAALLVVRFSAETMERYLFFVTAITSKMPGGMP
jgi:DMSO reductase anchor subunit